MKILIMSDSHGDVDIMCGAVEKEQPDMIIHLGDSIKDAEQLNLKYPDIRMYKNPGNIDSKEESIQYAEIYGKRFMMTHGNQFAVTSESPEINDEGREKMMLQLYHNKADILLHGHIHEPYLWSCQMTPTKFGWIMCPGRMGSNVNHRGTIHPIYGVLKINEADALEWQFVEVKE